MACRHTTSEGQSMLHALLSLLLLSPMMADLRPPAPAEGCLDARTVSQMRPLNQSTLLVASDQLRYRIEVDQTCPDLNSSFALLAEAGWVCGQAHEFVQTASQLCAIRSVQSITPKDYALLARAVDQTADGKLLPAIESRSHRGATRGFRGSFDYCFRPSLMRAWAADDDGILVQTSKRRSGGYGAYRLELGGSCPQIAFLPVLKLHSGVGLDLICGNVGDVALLSDDRSAYVSADTLESVRRDNRFVKASERPCQIVAVYPVYE